MLPTVNVDRSTWLSGPWDKEPDFVTWHSHGMPCVLQRNHNGAWCGYVGLEIGHPVARGFDWNFDVHGGVNLLRRDREEPLHWIGFDCGHAGDLEPTRAPGTFPSHVYRDMAFARREVEKLAEQAHDLMIHRVGLFIRELGKLCVLHGMELTGEFAARPVVDGDAEAVRGIREISSLGVQFK